MNLVEFGKALFHIVVLADEDHVVRFAAEELAKYVHRMTSVSIDITDRAGDGSLPAFVGTRQRMLEHGVKRISPPKAGYDGYSIQLISERLLIIGENPRGALYGVYDFLERCGCRWYYPEFDAKDPEIIPRQDTLSMNPMEISCAGGFKHRVAHIGSMIYDLDVAAALKHIDWAAKTRYNVLAFLIAGKGTGVPAQVTEDQMPPPPGTGSRGFYEAMWEYKSSGVLEEMRKRGLLLMGPMHCMVHFLPKDLFDIHPEWFGMKDGKRQAHGGPGTPEFCWSNEEAVGVFANNVVAFLKDFPYLDVFAFTPNDGGKPCDCPECRKHDPCDLYMNIGNVILSKVRVAGLQTAIEVTGGYPPVEGPPKRIKPDPEVRVHWAHFGRNHASCYGDPDYSYRGNLNGWLALGNEFTMVEYYTGGLVSPSIQPPVPQALSQDTPWLLQQGVKGNLMLMYPLEQWWNHGLNAWLGICFYYADRDPFDYLEDYCLHYYGAAGGPMLEYYTILSKELWLSYFCCGSRWMAQEWVNLAKAGRAEVLLDRLEVLMMDAQALAVKELDTYRLSRPVHQFKVLEVMGRAVIRNMRLVLDVGLAKSGGIEKGPLIEHLRGAVQREEEEVDPMIESLLNRKDGTIAAWMAGRMMRGAAKAMRVELERLEIVD